MKFNTHGNGRGLDDLFILPETKEAGEKVTAFLRSIGRGYSLRVSDVEGQPWHGKVFIDVPFGESLKPAIIAAVSGA